MGSAAVYHLARRGKRVLGIEQFDIPHDLGSSHGVTRIIRLAYFEDPSYVPLVRRAYELWRELEREAGEQLLHVTGAVEGGPVIFEGALRSCHEHDIPHEALDGAQVNQRFPAYHLPPDLQLVYQADGGFVVPERCVLAHVEGARASGADVRRERALSWEETRDGVRIQTELGAVYAEQLVLTAGAWSPDVGRLPAGLVVAQRQVLAWLDPLREELFTPPRFPVFNLSLEEGHLYGFPVFGVPGFKVGFYDRAGVQGHPDDIPRETSEEDEAVLRAFVYGLGSVLIGVGLERRGLSGFEVGLVLAALLAGSALVSVLIARYGDRVGRRRLYLLLLGAMGVAGTVFALTASIPALVIAALTGTVSTEVVESGPFTSLEQAMLPHAAEGRDATRLFGTYNTVATLAGPLGALAAGGPTLLDTGSDRWLLVYPLAAVLGLAVAAGLSPDVTRGRELEPEPRAPLHASRGIVRRLSGLFALDSLGGGFVTQTFMTFWFARTFGTSADTLGLVFFAVGIL